LWEGFWCLFATASPPRLLSFIQDLFVPFPCSEALKEFPLRPTKGLRVQLPLGCLGETLSHIFLLELVLSFMNLSGILSPPEPAFFSLATFFRLEFNQMLPCCAARVRTCLPSAHRIAEISLIPIEGVVRVFFCLSDSPVRTFSLDTAA